MKTLVMTSIKILAVTMLMATSFVLITCNSKHRADKKEKSSQKKIAAPSMDIHAAAFMGNLDAINQHINAGTDLNAKDDYGSTPLITATLFGKTDAALLLIKAGADVNMTNAEGSTALHTAAFFCRTKIVKALLENGADKNIRNIYGSTPMESVAGPFEDVRAIYDQIGKDLGPLGMKLDYERLEKTRPVIAEMLQSETVITRE